MFPVAVKFSYADSEDTDTRLLFLSFLSKKSGGTPLVYLAAPTHTLMPRFATSAPGMQQTALHGSWPTVSVFSLLLHTVILFLKYPISTAMTDGPESMNACLPHVMPCWFSTPGSRQRVWAFVARWTLPADLGIPAQLITTLGPGRYGIEPLPASVWGWDGVPDVCRP